MELSEVIAIAGGEATYEMLEERLTAAGASAVMNATGVGTSITQSIIEQLPFPNDIRLVFTRSTSPQCRSRRLSAQTSVILVPIGALARMHALTRRLVWHLVQDEPDPVVLASALDDPDPQWELAPLLVPVLGEAHAEDDTLYWEALTRFNLLTPPDELGDMLAAEFVWISSLYLLLHEVMHIAAAHDRVLKLVRADDPRIPRHLDETRLRRGMEIQADVLSAENLSRFLARDPLAARLVGEDPGSLFYKVSFALSAMFGMYDTHRKTIYEYDTGFYPHPIIRYEFFDEAFQTVMRDARPELAAAAQEYGEKGFVQCMHAYSAMEWQCLHGMYGRPPGAPDGTNRYVPVTTLKYGEAAQLRPRMIQDNQLFLEVANLSLEIALGAK